MAQVFPIVADPGECPVRHVPIIKLPTKSKFYPRPDDEILSRYNRTPCLNDNEGPQHPRATIKSNVDAFLSQANCLQGYGPSSYFPKKEYSSFKKKLIRESSDETRYYSHVQLGRREGSDKFRMNLLMKEVLLGDVALDMDAGRPNFNFESREKILASARDLYITYFLKHENILKSVLYTANIDTKRFCVFYEPHTTMRVIRNELRRFDPESDQIFDDMNIPKYVITQAAEALKYLNKSDVRLNKVSLDNIYVTKEGEVKIGDFEQLTVGQPCETTKGPNQRPRKNVSLFSSDESSSDAEPEPEEFHPCRPLGLVYLELVIPKYIEDYFNCQPTYEALYTIAEAMFPPKIQKYFQGVTKIITPEELYFVKECSLTFESQDELIKSSFLRNCSPDAVKEELGAIIKQLEVCLPESTFIPEDQAMRYMPRPLSFKCQNPLLISYRLTLRDSRFPEHVETMVIDVGNRHSMFKKINGLFEKKVSSNSSEFIFLPGDFLPISFYMHQFAIGIGSVLKIDRDNTGKSRFADDGKFRGKISKMNRPDDYKLQRQAIIPLGPDHNHRELVLSAGFHGVV